MTNPCRTLLTEMAAELDWRQQLLMDNRKATHPLADRARVLLDQQQPQPPAASEVAQLTALWEDVPIVNMDAPEATNV